MKRDKSISVALACRNGEQYIAEQLESIRQQTLEPDEVIIYDDASSDRTVVLVRKFIEKYGLGGRWSLIQNEECIGCERAFLKCAGLCSGEIIFYSDQDDLWDPEKIRVMADLFSSGEKVSAVCCNCHFIDENGKRLIKWQNFFTRKSGRFPKQYTVTEQIRYNRSAGLLLAFSRKLLPEITSITLKYGLRHDQPVGMIASLKGNYYVLSDKLVDHRIHEGNLSCPNYKILSRIRDISYQTDANEEHLKHMKAFFSEYGSMLSTSEISELSKAIEITEGEIACLKGRCFRKELSGLFKSSRMVNPWIRINNLFCILYRRLFGENGSGL